MTNLCLSNDYFDSSPIELPSSGVGEESKTVTSQLLDARRRFYDMSTTRQDWDDLEMQIQNEVFTSDLLVNVQKFVAKLPKWIGIPHADVYEDDGEVIFEWYEDPDHVVNAVVTNEGTIYYSGLLGEGIRRAENDKIDRGIPQGLISAIQRISQNR